MNTINDIELIERYFDNELSEQERTQLNDRLKTDFELKKLFDREKLLVNTIRFDAAHKNLLFLKQLEKSSFDDRTTHFKKYWYYYAAAACITVFVVAGVFFSPLVNETPAELYADYFEPYPNVFAPTLRSEEIIRTRTEAFQAYDQGDYKRASELFTGLIKENKEPGMLLLLGNANLVLGKTDEALINFQDLLNNYDDLDTQAKWFLSLCYLRKGDTPTARRLWKELEKTDDSYAVKAKELLNKAD